MDGCCDPSGYGALFGERFSRHLARRYRRKGLDRTATRMLDFLTAQGLDGASVLEIGGGVGALQLELLRRGASRATNLELVDSYEDDAAALAAEAGVADRMARRRVDLAANPEEVEPHDIVVLHRVVCCYPDYERLLGAAAGRASRLLVYSHPPRNAAIRAIFAGENLLFRLRRTTFRTFVHDPAAMATAAERGGLVVGYRHRGLAWHVVGLSAAA
jgi:2-polyprenyl-3-methyl-5-hydroxy-6-metoxy-1,4-benzoquinol methylase